MAIKKKEGRLSYHILICPIPASIICKNLIMPYAIPCHYTEDWTPCFHIMRKMLIPLFFNGVSSLHTSIIASRQIFIKQCLIQFYGTQH